MRRPTTAPTLAAPTLAALLAAAALVAPAAIAPALGDVVVRKDGTEVSGRVEAGRGGYTVTPDDGPVAYVPASDVKTVRLTGGGGPLDEGQAAQRLASLRRAARALDDPADAVARYDRLVEQLAGQPAVRAEAEADRATWQDRGDRGLVKVGDAWVTPDERAQLAINRLSTAAQVRDYLKQGRDDEAATLVDAALKQNPDDESALYLQGVILYRRGDLPQARRRFERVDEVAPGHAPTLNNLGVILLQQRQVGRGLKALSDAIAAAPVTRELLDNVAEALHAIPDGARDDRPTKQLAAEFERQDAALAERLEGQGLKRWGATWVDADQEREIEAAQAKANDRIAALQRDFDLTQETIARIDADVDRSQRTLRSMQAATMYYDLDGRPQARALPPAYYDVKRDLDRLQRDRADQSARIDALRSAAAEARADLPVPPFTGELQIVGEDGVPIVLPPGAEVPPGLAAPPTTAPAAPTAPTVPATP